MILTDKLSYFPGDTIHGRVLFELFDASFAKDLIIEFRGYLLGFSDKREDVKIRDKFSEISVFGSTL